MPIKGVVEKGYLMEIKRDFGGFKDYMKEKEVDRCIAKVVRRDNRRLRRLLRKEGHDVKKMTNEEIDALIKLLPREDDVNNLMG